MEWSRQYDEELSEMWEQYEQALPAIERICRQDSELEQVHKRLDSIEKRLLQLTGVINRYGPLLEYLLHKPKGIVR